MKIILVSCFVFLMAGSSFAENNSYQGKTADDQGMTQKDTDITRVIRRKITSDSSLSVNAQNIKIISENGRVVLKGSVASKAEKQKVGAIAKSVVGKTAVSNNTVIVR